MSTLLYLIYFFGATIFMLIPLAILVFRWELHHAKILHYSPDWNLYSVLYFVMCLMFQFTAFSFIALLMAAQTVK